MEAQHGGNANSYVVHQYNAELLAAKDELINNLREQLADKEALITAKDETIALLKKQSG